LDVIDEVALRTNLGTGDSGKTASKRDLVFKALIPTFMKQNSDKRSAKQKRGVCEMP
jgi:hypothetical protein